MKGLNHLCKRLDSVAIRRIVLDFGRVGSRVCGLAGWVSGIGSHVLAPIPNPPWRSWLRSPGPISGVVSVLTWTDPHATVFFEATCHFLKWWFRLFSGSWLSRPGAGLGGRWCPCAIPILRRRPG